MRLQGGHEIARLVNSHTFFSLLMNFVFFFGDFSWSWCVSITPHLVWPWTFGISPTILGNSPCTRGWDEWFPMDCWYPPFKSWMTNSRFVTLDDLGIPLWLGRNHKNSKHHWGGECCKIGTIFWKPWEKKNGYESGISTGIYVLSNELSFFLDPNLRDTLFFPIKYVYSCNR